MTSIDLLGSSIKGEQRLFWCFCDVSLGSTVKLPATPFYVMLLGSSIESRARPFFLFDMSCLWIFGGNSIKSRATLKFYLCCYVYFCVLVCWEVLSSSYPHCLFASPYRPPLQGAATYATASSGSCDGLQNCWQSAKLRDPAWGSHPKSYINVFKGNNNCHVLVCFVVMVFPLEIISWYI